MRSRTPPLTFAANKNGAGGNAGGAPANTDEKGSTAEVNTATKSLYLGVATGRAFPYVAQWLQGKSSEMRDKAGTLASECNTELVRQVDQNHKAIIEGRVASEKERQKMLTFLQEIQSVRVHQRAAGAAWLDAFRDAAAEYKAELCEVEAELRARLHLAEEWTVGGNRAVVMESLSRMQQQLLKLQRRAERERKRETMRREQTLGHMREAMEQLVGEVGDAVTWELRERMHGHARRLFSGRPTAVYDSARDDVSASDDAASSPPPEDEQELLEEARQLELELRWLQRRRPKRRGGDEGGSGAKRTQRPALPAPGAAGVAGDEGSSKGALLPQVPPHTPPWVSNAERTAVAAVEAFLSPQGSSASLRTHGVRTWTEVAEGLTLPPLATPQQKSGKAGEEGGGGERKASTAANVARQPPARGISSRTRRGKQQRGSLELRPPIVQPPNRVGRDASGSHNSDHIAGLLAALTEDTAHFAASREKMQTEVKRLREELQKHQEETARIMQVSIGLEAQRAQLLVQRDAQASKLQLVTAEKCSQERVRNMDAQLLNEELAHTLQVLEEQKQKRSAETAQVLESINDFKQRIADHNQLLQKVREYWRLNKAELSRVKYAGASTTTAASQLPFSSSGGGGGGSGGSSSSSSSSVGVSPTSVPYAFSATVASPLSRGPFEEEETPAAPPSKPVLPSTAGPEAILAEQVLGRCQAIPALGLHRAEEVAEFIYSVFEELAIAPPESGGGTKRIM
ncbi:uncharacterized protein Tco025E_01757 [Trypanosoma conorhini]|uniref:Uncharacterized protein n=1 Tax=Trypanosoma conorhini TaxID=83891 RepID=A0A3R7N635_9TRYP|nr:uncharacterized protein Tco025E_01757 [Trypanosoma conorhini]RNF26008.1 hypothetical protein Tco025E_01757 [Trypanosoma conorhini]